MEMKETVGRQVLAHWAEYDWSTRVPREASGQWLVLAGPRWSRCPAALQGHLGHTLTLFQRSLTPLESPWGLGDQVSRGNPVRHWGL